MKKIITITAALLLSTKALSVEGVYINESALELEEQYRNIAETLSQAYLEGGACGAEVEVYMDDIVEAAKKSRDFHDTNREYNENFEDLFSLKPSTLKVLKSTFALKDIMNVYERGDAASYEHALNRVVMWGPAPGAIGNATRLTFGQNNSVTFSYAEVIGQAPWVVWKGTEGSFRVSIQEHNKVVVTLEIEERDGHNQFELYYDWESQMWVMSPLHVEDANPFFDGFVDLPSECDA